MCYTAFKYEDTKVLIAVGESRLYTDFTFLHLQYWMQRCVYSPFSLCLRLQGEIFAQWTLLCIVSILFLFVPTLTYLW